MITNEHDNEPFFMIWPILEARAETQKYFCSFFEQMKTSKFAFEIYWPLATLLSFARAFSNAQACIFLFIYQNYFKLPLGEILATNFRFPRANIEIFSLVQRLIWLEITSDKLKLGLLKYEVFHHTVSDWVPKKDKAIFKSVACL